jgi:hypothetical protein
MAMHGRLKIIGVGLLAVFAIAKAECPNGGRNCPDNSNGESSCFNEPPPNLDLCKLEFSNDKCEKYVCLDKTYCGK